MGLMVFLFPQTRSTPTRGTTVITVHPVKVPQWPPRIPTTDKVTAASISFNNIIFFHWDVYGILHHAVCVYTNLWHVLHTHTSSWLLHVHDAEVNMKKKRVALLFPDSKTLSVQLWHSCHNRQNESVNWKNVKVATLHGWHSCSHGTGALLLSHVLIWSWTDRHLGGAWISL